jgi:hypothetical protein
MEKRKKKVHRANNIQNQKRQFKQKWNFIIIVLEKREAQHVNVSRYSKNELN